MAVTTRLPNLALIATLFAYAIICGLVYFLSPSGADQNAPSFIMTPTDADQIRQESATKVAQVDPDIDVELEQLHTFKNVDDLRNALNRHIDRVNAKKQQLTQDAAKGSLEFEKVRVTLVSATTLPNFRHPNAAKTLLRVVLQIENLNEYGTLHYRGWGPISTSAPAQTTATLKDNLDRTYQGIDTGLSFHKSLISTLYPHNPVGDVLFFEAPTGNFDYVELRLPGTSFGAKSAGFLRISKELIGKPKFFIPMPPTQQPVARPDGND